MMCSKAAFPTVRSADLVDALEFVSVTQADENQAWLCRATGRILFVSDDFDPEEDMPDDPEAAGYIVIPHWRYLDLGKPLAISFVDAERPAHAVQARHFFRRKRAYGHFKHLLHSAGALTNGMTMWRGRHATRCDDGARRLA